MERCEICGKELSKSEAFTRTLDERSYTTLCEDCVKNIDGLSSNSYERRNDAIKWSIKITENGLYNPSLLPAVMKKIKKANVRQNESKESADAINSELNEKIRKTVKVDLNSNSSIWIKIIKTLAYIGIFIWAIAGGVLGGIIYNFDDSFIYIALFFILGIFIGCIFASATMIFIEMAQDIKSMRNDIKKGNFENAKLLCEIADKK